MAEPAYQYRSNPKSNPAPRLVEPARTPLRVLPKPASQARTAPRQAGVPASLMATIVLSLGILALAVFANVGLVNATMRMMLVTNQLEQEISQARSDGHQLESLYSGLTNPQRIQQIAEELGMMPDPSPEYLRLSSPSVDLPEFSEEPLSADATPEESAPMVRTPRQRLVDSQ